MTIHLLRFGQTPCAMPGLPASWPAGHTWVSFQDTERLPKVNCQECLDAEVERKKLRRCARHGGGTNRESSCEVCMGFVSELS